MGVLETFLRKITNIPHGFEITIFCGGNLPALLLHHWNDVMSLEVVACIRSVSF